MIFEYLKISCCINQFACYLITLCVVTQILRFRKEECANVNEQPKRRRDCSREVAGWFSWSWGWQPPQSFTSWKKSSPKVLTQYIKKVWCNLLALATAFQALCSLYLLNWSSWPYIWLLIVSLFVVFYWCCRPTIFLFIVFEKQYHSFILLYWVINARAPTYN